AHFHLDRLIAAQPERALWRAWLAHFHLLEERRDDAEREYRAALERGPASAVHDWQAQRQADCQTTRQWSRALWHLDRLVAARSGEVRWYVERARVHQQVGQEEACATDLAAAVERGAGSRVVLQLAEVRATQERWADAARYYSQAIDQRNGWLAGALA